jgi:hypothetical protein
MVLTPSKIFQDIKGNRLDKSVGIRYLITIIENSLERELRYKALEHLKLLNNNSPQIFTLLENLLISDSYEKIRLKCAIFLRNDFLSKAFSPMRWALHNEQNYYCQIEIIKTLTKIATKRSKQLLVKELKKLIAKGFLDEYKRFENNKFRGSVKKLLRGRSLDELSIDTIAEIIINHKTLSHLIKRFYFVYFDWDHGLVSELDLSDLGWNVSKSWEFIDIKKINELSQIPALRNLKKLKKLNLSNNEIKDLKELIPFKHLVSLNLKNNRLEDPKNITYLKQMKKLRFVVLKGNKLAKSVKKDEFSNVNLVLRDYLIST